MTIDEIINGKPGVFEGLVPLVKLYLKQVVQPSEEAVRSLFEYLNLISRRASGEIPTGAKF
jgi:glutamate--cysteine ligase catalytic subunit